MRMRARRIRTSRRSLSTIPMCSTAGRGEPRTTMPMTGPRMRMIECEKRAQCGTWAASFVQVASTSALGASMRDKYDIRGGDEKRRGIRAEPRGTASWFWGPSFRPLTSFLAMDTRANTASLTSGGRGWGWEGVGFGHVCLTSCTFRLPSTNCNYGRFLNV